MSAVMRSALRIPDSAAYSARVSSCSSRSGQVSVSRYYHPHHTDVIAMHANSGPNKQRSRCSCNRIQTHRRCTGFISVELQCRYLHDSNYSWRLGPRHYADLWRCIRHIDENSSDVTIYMQYRGHKLYEHLWGRCLNGPNFCQTDLLSSTTHNCLSQVWFRSAVLPGHSKLLIEC